MTILIHSLISLLILMVLNILLGTFNNIKEGKFKFDFKKFLIGIYKAFLICISTLGVYFVFHSNPYITEIVDPILVIQAAVIYYLGKVILQLKNLILPEDIEIPGLEETTETAETPFYPEDYYLDCEDFPYQEEEPLNSENLSSTKITKQ